MNEKVSHRGGDDGDTERMRREVVYLLQSILGEVTVQANATQPTPLHAPARQAVQVYEDMLARLTLNAGL